MVYIILLCSELTNKQYKTIELLSLQTNVISFSLLKPNPVVPSL